jgi:hypothetical protein
MPSLKAYSMDGDVSTTPFGRRIAVNIGGSLLEPTTD